MTSLAESFQRRQPHPRDSISTVASSEVEDRINHFSTDDKTPQRNDFLENQARMIFNWCKEIRIGENVTNVNYNYLFEGDEVFKF
jgi:hypothetical protein